jgi:hypothetical protein
LIKAERTSQGIANQLNVQNLTRSFI